MEKKPIDAVNSKRAVSTLEEEPTDGNGLWGFNIYDITHIEYNPGAKTYNAWEFIDRVEAFIPSQEFYIGTVTDKDFDIAQQKIIDFCAQKGYLVYGEDSDEHGDSIPIFE